MDWIHCNNCFIQPGDLRERTFVITNCAHIYCSECISLPDLKQCRICRSSYHTMPLTSKLSKELEPYFADPKEDIQKQLKVMEFQQSHRTRLAAFNKERLNNYQTLKQEYSILKDEVKRLQAEKISLLDENKRVKAELLQYKKKFEYFQNYNSSGFGESKTSPFPDGCSQKITPHGVKTNRSAEGRANVLKRPPEGSNFFLMSSTKSSQHENRLFTPTISKIPGSYGSSRSPASVMSALTPESRNRDYFQKDPHHRKVYMPGDRGKSSPAIKAVFNRLTLSKLTSTPKNENSNKYSHYFRK